MKEVLFNTHDLVLIITIYQCLLFAIFLVSLKKGKKLSNYLLAAFLLTQAAIPLDNLINFGEAFRLVALETSPNLFYTFGLAFWLEAPLLLLYIRSLMYKDYRLCKFDALYFLPFVLFASHFVFDWILLDTNSKLISLQGDTIAQTDIFHRTTHVVRELFRLVLGIMCLIELHKYQKSLKREVADIESVDLNWLKILVVGFLVMRISAVFVAFAIVSSYEFGISFDHEFLGLSSNYAVMLLISGLIFFSAGYSSVFKGIDRKLNDAESEKDKEKEPIDMQQVAKIEQYMVSGKPYLNHLLTLENLANQLQINNRSLSIILNRHFGKNFYEFINFYRVEESKSLLTSELHRKTTMLEIMDDVGFNSKATFNTFFKKLVGVTPTQYRKDFWQQQELSKNTTELVAQGIAKN